MEGRIQTLMEREDSDVVGSSDDHRHHHTTDEKVRLLRCLTELRAMRDLASTVVETVLDPQSVMKGTTTLLDIRRLVQHVVRTIELQRHEAATIITNAALPREYEESDEEMPFHGVVTHGTTFHSTASCFKARWRTTTLVCTATRSNCRRSCTICSPTRPPPSTDTGQRQRHETTEKTTTSWSWWSTPSRVSTVTWRWHGDG